MAGAERGSQWKQGDLIEPSVASDLLGVPSEGLRVAIASHTCDLQDSGVEPQIALLIGKVTTKLDGNKRHAKGVRQLQLLATSGELAEFDIRSIHFISAELLRPHSPWSGTTFPADEVRSLQRWLAQRYERVAYPDAFVATLQRSKLANHLRTRLKGADSILDVRFALDESLRPSGPYRLALILIYDTDEDPTGAKSDQLAGDIRSDFEAAERQLDGVIDFLGISAQPDAEVSFRAIRRTRAWRLDDLSLRDEGEGHPFPAA